MLNNICKVLFGLLLSCCGFQNVNASPAPKREFRAVWVATVGNIDWPSRQGLSADQQKAEFIQKLNFLSANGFNAVIVQIRPASDALYHSPFEPWSRYLSGKQGVAPSPFYDPLLFMIEETHKRNMEFHAWINPFRALTSTSNPNPETHVTKTNPSWVINYGGKAYLDPGNPLARKYVLKIVNDIVSRYDIDGIHIDDYFYPYKIPNQNFNDQSSYDKFGDGMTIGDWRRDNINQFVKELYQQTKATKRYVKVGISPFGIWRNQRQDPLGSATNGTSCYDDLYADVKLWIDNKWVDYVAPQLYWEYGHRLAAYEILLNWWENNCRDRHLYIGLGLYRMTDAKVGSPYYGPNQILRQIDGIRDQRVLGSIMYSLVSFSKIGSGLSNQLQTPEYFGNIAIPPPMNWLDNEAPYKPMVKMTLSSLEQNPVLRYTSTSSQKETVKYLIYRFDEGQPININDASKLIAITQKESFEDRFASKSNKYKYVVTVVDRMWNESPPSEVVVY